MKEVRILYTNHRGEVGWRRIFPQHIVCGSTDWHPEVQWLLRAFDLDRKAERDFALKDIKEWKEVESDD